MVGLIIINGLFFYTGFHYLKDPKGIKNNFVIWINSFFNNTKFIN